MLSSTVKGEELPGEMRALNVVFPIGATLTVLEGCFSKIWSNILVLGARKVGAIQFCPSPSSPGCSSALWLAIVGSFIDRKRLPVTQSRARGILCWTISGIFFPASYYWKRAWVDVHVYFPCVCLDSLPVPFCCQNSLYSPVCSPFLVQLLVSIAGNLKSTLPIAALQGS
jgi:hypothetical protein